MSINFSLIEDYFVKIKVYPESYEEPADAFAIGRNNKKERIEPITFNLNSFSEASDKIKKYKL
jgi:hypothetical protein